MELGLFMLDPKARIEGDSLEIAHKCLITKKMRERLKGRGWGDAIT